ncbi:MAG: diguanylate cyclase [Nitrospirota bacterium]
MSEIIDFENFLSLVTYLSDLTGLSLSVYGDKGNIIQPATIDDKFLSYIKTSPMGRDEYNDFLKRCIGKAIQRKRPSIFKGPAGQQHFFIPVTINDLTFVISGGVYFSSEEFKDFYIKEGPSYGLSPKQIDLWRDKIAIRDYTNIMETSTHIGSLINLFLKENYEGNLNKKRYRLTKTILSLLSNIKLDNQFEAVSDMLVDILLFLFNVDSVSVMVKDNDIFRPKKIAGRLRENLKSLSLTTTGIISEVIEKQRPLYSDNTMEILRLGLPDMILSIYIFPIIAEDKVTGLVCIFNPAISREDVDIISELCNVGGFIFRLSRLQNLYGKRLKDMDILNIVSTSLCEVKEPEILYETIVDKSVELTYAERGSLMLMDTETPYLTIKAAKGVNKLLLNEIKIKAGEGIAGRVFKEGIPLLVHDIETNERIPFKKKPSYKTGSFVSIPIKIGERTIGVLNISDKITGEVFSESDMALLRSFASYASIALERSMCYSLAGHLRELSITDSLTSLFNRRYFEERFFEELQRSERHGLSFSLAMVDIDDFKLFNDTEGHLAGDEVLKHIANIIKESLRVVDVVTRFGGEEFVIIMPQTDKQEAFMVAERVRESAKTQIPHFWKTFPKENITITVGVSTFPSDGKEMKELIRNADKALYRGKMAGKDRVFLYNIPEVNII